MSKFKLRNSIWAVLFEGIKIYFSNIDKFFVYMLFPVFGQLIGLALIFGLTIGLASKVGEKSNSLTSAMILLFLLALPGVFVFIKAFWEYMVAYVSLNSMTEGAITAGRVYDFQSHKEVATRRSFKYIGFLIVVGFLSLVAALLTIIPVLGLIPPLIVWIYFILVYQVFTFEEDLNIKDCFKRSFNLIRGDWARTFLLMIILGFFSVYIITMGVSVIFDLFNLTSKISSLFNFIGESLPIDLINRALNILKLPNISIEKISQTVFLIILGSIISGLSLPIRSVCYTLWYKTLVQIKSNQNSISKERKTKKYKQVEE